MTTEFAKPRVGPTVLLGLRPRFVQRATAVARDDERVRALLVWGALARGDADEWSGVDFVMSVPDESVNEVLDELSQRDSPYGRSLVTLRTPQKGVAGGGVVNVTYLQSGLPLSVEWYVCPLSVGFPIRDTKPLIARDGWPRTGVSFAELLGEQPSRETLAPAPWDLVASGIPHQIGEVVRGRPEAVLIDGVPAVDQIEAYDALGRLIAQMPAEYGSELRAALFYYLGLARRGR
jgi:hypothetical protein